MSILTFPRALHISSYEFAILSLLTIEAKVKGSAKMRGEIIFKMTKSPLPEEKYSLSDQNMKESKDMSFIGPRNAHK